MSFILEGVGVLFGGATVYKIEIEKFKGSVYFFSDCAMLSDMFNSSTD